MFHSPRTASHLAIAMCWASLLPSAILARGAKNSTRSLTPEQERILQREPISQPRLSQQKERLVNVEMNLARFLSFRSDVLRTAVFDSKLITIRRLNQRTIAINGLASGQSLLHVFTARFRGDKVGQAQVFRIAIRTQNEIATERAAHGLVFLRPVLLADTTPAKYLWRINVLDDTIFSSLNAPALYAWLATLPANTKIFLQGTKEWEKDSTAYSKEEWEALHDFCAARDLKLIGSTPQNQSQTP